MIREMRAAIFDLDGVIVDTAKYHYLVWKRLANELGFDFTQTDNERLKGVSRTRSLEILLEIGGLTLDDAVKSALGSASKNAPLILERLGISSLFDVIVDGNKVSQAKPDPEVFLCAAEG